MADTPQDTSTTSNPLRSLEAGGRRDQWEPDGAPRLVLLDLDGTLMGSTRRVTEPVVAAVRDVVDAGLFVGFATGRPVSGVGIAQEQLQLDGPHIVLNGAQVRRGGAAVKSWPLTPAQRQAVLDLCARAGLYAELYTDDSLLVTSFDERFRAHWEEVIGMPEGTVADRPDLAAQTIKMTIVTTSPQQRSDVEKAITDLGLSAGPATSPVTPGLTYINITRPDADKGTAVRACADLLGIDVSAVVAVGDGANDLPMLTAAGTAIVMGGAEDAVAAAAHHLVPSVEQDGAAVALRAVLAWAGA